MQAPFVCLVVAHGWNIIEDFPAAVHWCGRWWVQTRCWVLGEQAPAVDSSWMSRWWVCGCLLGRSWSCVLLWVGCVGGCLVVDHGFFIVDASIWTSRLSLLGGVVVFCVIFVLSASCVTRPALPCFWWGGVSVQERMVDALASGADEGRGNLR